MCSSSSAISRSHSRAASRPSLSIMTMASIQPETYAWRSFVVRGAMGLSSAIVGTRGLRAWLPAPLSRALGPPEQPSLVNAAVIGAVGRRILLATAVLLIRGSDVHDDANLDDRGVVVLL